MLKNLKKLNRTDLREIQGGGGIEKCDIGPIGCPCKIPPGDPCLGGGGTPPTPDYGYCPDTQGYILCTEICPNGMSPYCALP
ncbi:bacteriocin-like protein [Chryseobacterium sp. CBSDS_008]|uniref:bacteriocin-like protein n=1 Tax=Chryseobacterium sp. CBSDS_008 TaxID=3415265 RepID=UPI003CF47B18